MLVPSNPFSFKSRNISNLPCSYFVPFTGNRFTFIRGWRVFAKFDLPPEEPRGGNAWCLLPTGARRLFISRGYRFGYCSYLSTFPARERGAFEVHAKTNQGPPPLFSPKTSWIPHMVATRFARTWYKRSNSKRKMPRHDSPLWRQGWIPGKETLYSFLCS